VATDDRPTFGSPRDMFDLAWSLVRSEQQGADRRLANGTNRPLVASPLRPPGAIGPWPA
jgi:hypothetical protein